MNILSIRGRRIIERRITVALVAARQHEHTARQLRADHRGGQQTAQHATLITGCIERAKAERSRAALLNSLLSGGVV